MVGWWKRIWTTTTPQSAEFTCWRPPRLSRWRSVLPEEAGTEQTPASPANAAWERIRSGLPPTTTSTSVAVSAPIPNASTRFGAFWRVSSPSSRWWPLFSSPRSSQRRASDRWDRLVEARTMVTEPGRSSAHRSMRAIFGRHWSCSRSSSGTVTIRALRVTLAWVRNLTVVSRAILVWQIISTVPSAHFGVAVAVPATTARAALSASMGSDLPRWRRTLRSRRPGGGSVHLHSRRSFIRCIIAVAA